MSATQPPADTPRKWFGGESLPSVPPSQPLLASDAVNQGESARMWKGLMSARVLIALMIFALHLALNATTVPVPSWLLTTCLGYLGVTVLTRMLARTPAPQQPYDPRRLYPVGVDVAFIFILQTQRIGGITYIPLLALVVVLAAIMNSRMLALGTAALATLGLLGHAIWVAHEAAWNTDVIVQAGITGAGLLVLALLTNQLSGRLAREEARARRSRGEARIQALVNSLVIETLADGVLVVDASGTVRAANPAAHLMLGIDPEVTPSQFNLSDSPGWAQLLHTARLTFTGGPIDGVDITLHHEDRPASHLQVRTQRTPSIGDGALCVMFLQDLRELETRLRTEKLVAMGRMSAAVAHEIRNPLAAISQANALLEEELTSPAQQRLTEMVRQNAQRLGNIAADVLDIVRVQGNLDAGTIQTVGLDELTQAFCAEWSQQHAPGARLQVDLHAPDVQVQFAHDHLRRILVNLLDNAARYASQQPGAIQVHTHTVRYGPAVLAVWSDGAPLDEAVSRHMFEPFFSSESRSSGLGLFICRELCERHGALIAHDSVRRERAGQAVDGNEFSVSLRRMHGEHSTLNFEDSQA